MADLESSLHYIFLVEVGKFSVLEGQRLLALKKLVAVLAKVSRASASFVSVVPYVVSVHVWKPYTIPAHFLNSGLTGHLDLWLSRSPIGYYPYSASSRDHTTLESGEERDTGPDIPIPGNMPSHPLTYSAWLPDFSTSLKPHIVASHILPW